MFEVITVQEAFKIVGENVPGAGAGEGARPEEVPITGSLHRVTAEEVASPGRVPHFDRSTMDGYAVKARDTYGASEENPRYLQVKGRIPMGQAPPGELGPWQAWGIGTGGMMPGGADSVLMLEHALETVDQLMLVYKAVAPGENVILAGEDLEPGEVILPKNHRLRPQDAGALAAAGVTRVKVFPRPRVAIISTGDELVPPGEEPGPGQVRDVNSLALSLAVQAAGGVPLPRGIVRDREETLQEALGKALGEADLVLVSGGSSVGTRDFTARVIENLGEPGVLFHGISLRPGKPTIFGRCGRVPFFGLSGNPVSALVTFDLFVVPALEKLAGLLPGSTGARQARVKARVDRNIPSARGREDYIRVTLVGDEETGETRAVPVWGKAGLITTLVEARGLFRISQNKEGVQAGEEVEVILY